MRWQLSVDNEGVKQLQGIIAFIETADAGTLAAAARRLDVTSAAVSKNLQRLEARLGVRLIQRNTRRMRLTAEGAVFLDKARAALRDLDDAVTEVSGMASRAAGRVRVSVGVSFGRRWLLPALPSIVREHPQLQIEVDFDNRPADLVAEGYDIGVRGGAPAHASLVARRLCGLPVVLVASPAYLRYAGVPKTPRALAEHQCIQHRFSDGSLSRWSFLGAARRQRHDIEPVAALIVDESDAVVDLALADAGIAQTGLYGTLPHLRAGRLKLVLADCHDPGEREFHLHYPHRQFLAPRVRAVVDAFLAHLRATPDLHVQCADLPAAFRA